MRFRSTGTCFALFLVMALSSVSAEEKVFRPPDTPGGACVADYFTAFNSGEDAMKAFTLKCFAEQSLKRRTMEERLEMYRNMREQLGRLRPDRVIKADTAYTTVLAAADNDTWLAFTFQIEAVPPHALLSIRIEETDPALFDQPQTPMSEKEFLDSLGKRLVLMEQRDEFSGVVVIARHGNPIFQNAYGLADKAFNVPNQLDTKFNLGSINKFFTRIAVGQLIEQGRVTFEDTLGKFLPDYPNPDARRKVTVEHLINMSAGVGDFFGENFENTPKDRFRSNSNFLPMFDSLPLRFEPGTKQEYSNGGYVVLGAIIEKVNGQSYYDYVREHIFRPAGMTNTDSYEADLPVANLAEGYTRMGAESGAWRRNIYTRPARGSAAGGGYSTADDLLRFVVALQASKLLTPAYTEWLRTGERPDLPKAKPADSAVPKVIGIAGGAPGINACLDADLNRGYTVIVLGNYDPPNAERVARLARGWLGRVTESR